MNNFRKEIHAKKVEERCRVCGRFLVEVRDKKTRKHITADSLQRICTPNSLLTPPWIQLAPTHHSFAIGANE